MIIIQVEDRFHPLPHKSKFRITEV
uniref:Uncharacterized protein n=1 Tax=Rhizophora mucronata TaxID=61149 RepID=A0A2P2R2M3_RHIMU